MNFYQQNLTYKSYVQKLDDIKSKYSNIINLFSIGKSVLNRDIYAIRIGNTDNTTLMIGATHAQEWITTLVLIKFIEDICYYINNKDCAYGTDISKRLDNKGLVIIPMLNPDGVEIAVNGPSSAVYLKDDIIKFMKNDSRSWQSNAHGVDLNHNFNAGYNISKQNEILNGITSPSPRQYGGETYHSEPEVISLVNFCENNFISMAFSFHSQGEEIFYEYGDKTPLVSKYIANILANMCFYEVSKQKGLASHAGFKDWFIETYERPAFTIEVGKGENPLPLTQLDDIYYRIRKALFTIISL